MQTLTRVKAAKELIDNMKYSHSVSHIIDACCDEEGQVEHEEATYLIEQVEEYITHLLDTPNDTLPTLVRLREAAVEAGFDVREAA